MIFHQKNEDKTSPICFQCWKCGDGRTPQVMLIFGNQGKASGHPLRRAQPSTIPRFSWGKKHWLSGIASLACSSLGQVQHLQPTALGWALAAASVTIKHKVSPCATTLLDYLASSFLHFTTQQHPVLSISQHQESDFEGAFFVCLFTGFIWRHDIICQTRRWRHRVLNFCSGEAQV